MASSEIRTLDVEVAEKTAQTASTASAGFLTRPAEWTICLSLLLAVAVLRIGSTYHVFNATIDEASHIAGGIEWWDKGTYTLETKHTPLARVSVALGQYMAGVRGVGVQSWRVGNRVVSHAVTE